MTAVYKYDTTNTSRKNLTSNFWAENTHSARWLSYFGSRYYDSELSIWLSVDPMASKYPSLTPYAYCSNNPIMLIDPNGEEISPYYDKEGRFLGNDENGFTGKIYITTKEAFDKSATNGVANSTTLQADNATKSIDQRALSNEARSNIYTHVLKQMKDINFDNLYNGKVSILESAYTNSNGDRVASGYNDPDVSAFNGQASGVRVPLNDGSSAIKVTAYSFESLGTVEGVQNMLGVHEYKGHGVNKWGANGTHWKCYQLQMQHSTYQKLPNSIKTWIQEQRNKFKQNGW